MVKQLSAFLFAAAILQGCEEQPLIAVGQLESDRVEIVTESNEPIIAINVIEGDVLQAGDLLLQQDAERFELQRVEIASNVTRMQAILQEQLNGPRIETIAAARASLKNAEIEREFRARDLQRLTGLRDRNLTSIESVDTAENLYESALADIELISAQLAELEAGTRVEQVAQTRASLAQLEAQLQTLEYNKNRLRLTAPVAGVVDSLPFELGERPRQGDVVAVLLTGEQPYARVYIPEPLRASVTIGAQLPLYIDGVVDPVSATVRRIASEPAFTPYFALTERDRSRLSYVAELSLPQSAVRMPEGLPVQILFE